MLNGAFIHTQSKELKSCLRWPIFPYLLKRTCDSPSSKSVWQGHWRALVQKSLFYKVLPELQVTNELFQIIYLVKIVQNYILKKKSIPGFFFMVSFLFTTLMENASCIFSRACLSRATYSVTVMPVCLVGWLIVSLRQLFQLLISKMNTRRHPC